MRGHRPRLGSLGRSCIPQDVGSAGDVDNRHQERQQAQASDGCVDLGVARGEWGQVAKPGNGEGFAHADTRLAKVISGPVVRVFKRSTTVAR